MSLAHDDPLDTYLLRVFVLLITSAACRAPRCA